MFQINFTLIHKFDQALDIGECNILHDDNRVTFTGIIGKDRVEKCTTGTQYHPMSPNQLALTGQSDITKTAPIQELREHSL